MFILIQVLSRGVFAMNNADFMKWLREVINPKAGPGNNACVDDFT